MPTENLETFSLTSCSDMLKKLGREISRLESSNPPTHWGMPAIMEPMLPSARSIQLIGLGRQLGRTGHFVLKSRRNDKDRYGDRQGAEDIGVDRLLEIFSGYGET
jgi:hypothetical protein